jgi:hypothetical protein
MDDNLNISEYPLVVIFTETFLPTIIRWMNPSFSSSKMCFDAACWDFFILLPKEEVVIGTKLCRAPFEINWVKVRIC